VTTDSLKIAPSAIAWVPSFETITWRRKVSRAVSRGAIVRGREGRKGQGGGENEREKRKEE